MTKDFARYGSLLAAALLFSAGAAKQPDDTGAVFMAAGLVSFGCWIVLEVMATLRRYDQIYDRECDEEEGSEDATD